MKRNQTKSKAVRLAVQPATFDPRELEGLEPIASDDAGGLRLPGGRYSACAPSSEDLYRTKDGRFVLEHEDLLLDGKPISHTNAEEFDKVMHDDAQRQRRISHIKTYRQLTTRQSMEWLSKNYMPHEFRDAFLACLPAEKETPVSMLDDDEEFKAAASANGWTEIISAPGETKSGYWRSLVIDKRGNLFDVTKGNAPRKLSVAESVQVYREMFSDFSDHSYGSGEAFTRYLRILEQVVNKSALLAA